MNQLLSNLLLWSQAQWQQVSFHPQRVQVASVIQEVLLVESFPMEMKGIQVIQKVDESHLLMGDPNMVPFIIRNLIGNAIKFSPPKGRIFVETDMDSFGLELRIRDEGIGLGPEQLAEFQEKGTFPVTRGTEKEKGVGLGLLLCKEFMEKHGGSLRFESENGTTAICYFPLKMNHP